MRQLSTLLVLLVFIFPSHSISGEEQAKAQVLGREFPDECPGEGGCNFGTWTAQSTVSAYAERSVTSPVAFKLSKGDKVTGLSAVLVVNKPGSCTAKEEVSAIPPTGGAEIKIPSGTKLPLYFYEGEGRVRVEFNDEAVTLCCQGGLACDTTPETDLWLQIRSKSGRIAWTNQRDKFSGTSMYD